MKVLIVGAGPTGLTAAVELARLGIVARIIDKKTKRSTLSRAVGILPNSLKLLENSGVNEKLIEAGIQINNFNVYAQSNRIANISLNSVQSDYPYVLALAQDRTEQILESAFMAFGGQVEYGQTLHRLSQSREGVQAEFEHGNSHTFDLVLAADGVDSRCRQSLGLDFPGFELNQTWSIADVDATDWQHPDAFTLFRFKKGRVAVVVPLEPDRYRLISNTVNLLADLPIRLNVLKTRRQGTFNIAIRQVINYHSGNVYLAGDAAHCHSPVGGRGMNLGIADAVEFARRLHENTLDQYSVSRHQHGANAIKASERFRSIITGDNYFISSLVNAGFRVIDSIPKLQAIIARNILSA